MHISWIWIVLAAAIAVAAIVLVVITKDQGTGKLGFPYVPAKALFSAAERSFLGALDEAVGPDYRVFGKVRVGDVAAVKSGLTNSARQAALNRIAQKHFDFVVCRASDLAMVCAVELNDSSHASRQTQARDDLLNKVCATIKLPLLLVTAQRAYAVPTLREQFLAAILAVEPLSASSQKGSDPVLH